MGWDLTSSIDEVDLIDNFLKPKDSTYEGMDIGLTKSEAEIELWRRIILNTPWIWKSKGTRKTIEFLFKFIGTPDGLVTFNEYVYVAEKALDVEKVKDMMEFFNETRDISDLNLDEEGFPKVMPNNSDMYFQKAGLWYRTTGGPTPDIDILYGNNPHIGPYDGGQAYIDQFTNCLIPNFVGSDGIEDINEIGDANLFTNFNNGTFDSCCEGDILVELNTDINFSAIQATNIAKFIDGNPVSESGCTINSDWSIKAYLAGELFHEVVFFSGNSTPTSVDYIDGLNTLSGTTELSGTTTQIEGDTYRIFDDYSDCESDLEGTYLKIEVCITTDFDCISEVEPDANITGDNEIDCD